MTLVASEAQRALAATVADAPAPAVGQTERDALHARFADRLIVRRELSRRLVSYQGNRAQPGLRWLRYKEGFSAGALERLGAIKKTFDRPPWPAATSSSPGSSRPPCASGWA